MIGGSTAFFSVARTRVPVSAKPIAIAGAHTACLSMGATIPTEHDVVQQPRWTRVGRQVTFLWRAKPLPDHCLDRHPDRPISIIRVGGPAYWLRYEYR